VLADQRVGEIEGVVERETVAERAEKRDNGEEHGGGEEAGVRHRASLARFPGRERLLAVTYDLGGSVG
jgi:hypothetical protein